MKIFILLILFPYFLGAQNLSSLQHQIDSIAQKTKATVGVSVMTSAGEAFTYNDTIAFAMLSTFKWPLAMAVLHKLDRFDISPDSTLFITKNDLLPNTYSPLRDARPEGNFPLSIRQLLQYSVAQSDNNACDILIRFIGDIDSLQQYVNRIGIPQMHIVATEEQMHIHPSNQYLNHTLPSSATLLIQKFLLDNLLSPNNQQLLKDILITTSTGTDKLKANLPANVIIGHKTGSSDRIDGIKIADNDMGFVYLPDGRQYSIAIFIMNSQEDDKTNAAVIAHISKIVYDFIASFSPKN